MQSMSGSGALPIAPIQVLAISPGIAIGPVRLYGESSSTEPGQVIRINADQVETELQRLQDALNAAISELFAVSEHVAKTVGRNEADIFAAQQLMLQDPELLEEMQELIAQQHYAAISALWQAVERQAKDLESLESELLAARASDIRDAAARAARHLAGAQFIAPENTHDIAPQTPIIIVANDLTPSDTANLDPKTILGICTVVGGPTTHAAILARALEIPAIAGIDRQLLNTLQYGQQIALDGTRGLLYLSPDDDLQQQFHTAMQYQQEERAARRRQNLASWRNQPGSTADGVAVQIFANVGDIESARAAGEVGAEGIGLLRTEFLFGGRSVFPDEQEQYESYVALFQAFDGASPLGNTIVARTLDAGADKPFPALEPLIGALHEANPALGLRGVRIHLVYEALLRQQLRALLRAAAQTAVQLHIMFPMVATLEEVRRLRAIYTAVQQELDAEGINLSPDTQMGIMIETPAAAIMADVLAREVDFFSIGANDLFQYTLAADRTNSHVMGMFGILEPSVWRLIEQVVSAGKAYGKTVALCGELAADPRIAPLLAGLGVQELSLSPAAVARVKAALHEHTMEYWQELAYQLLKTETAEEMQALISVAIESTLSPH
ncbi:MAG: phosphoenolpyruvate-protein phosphotransferase PtsI [Ktedonobacteraceae bacterium]